ncbi:hypothetical protein LEMLEM_LOCUS813 [Lemmus lemmus]
MLQNPIRPI